MVTCLFINDVLCMLEYYQYRETTHGFQTRNMAEGLTYKDVETVKGTGAVLQLACVIESLEHAVSTTVHPRGG